MRIHLISRHTVLNFISQHSGSRASFKEWLKKIKKADLALPGDIKYSFQSADVLGRGSNRFIFDVGGNHYRIICKYEFGENKVRLFVCWIRTHGDYDKLCKDNLQYSIRVY